MLNIQGFLGFKPPSKAPGFSSTTLLDRARIKTDKPAYQLATGHGGGGNFWDIYNNDDQFNRWDDENEHDPKSPPEDELNNPDNWGLDPGIPEIIKTTRQQLVEYEIDQYLARKATNKA